MGSGSALGDDGRRFVIQLDPMTREECRAFLAWAAEDYAREQVKAGAWAAKEAPRLAKRAISALLPQGNDTPGHFLSVIRRTGDGQPVGSLWFAVREEGGRRFAAVYNIVILEAHRRCGYGAAALRAMEKKVRDAGLSDVALHVFAHNHAARALYRKLGYVERSLMMAKHLDDPAA